MSPELCADMEMSPELFGFAEMSPELPPALAAVALPAMMPSARSPAASAAPSRLKILTGFTRPPVRCGNVLSRGPVEPMVPQSALPGEGLRP